MLRDVHEVTDRVMVGLSGGKDSMVVLDLCCAEFGADNVVCYSMYMVRDLRCVNRTIDWCRARYGVQVHHYPHWVLGRAYKYATYMPHREGMSELRDMRVADVEQKARQDTGVTWLAYGHRMTDSIERVGMLTKIGGLDRVGHRVYPLWRWNEASVVAYMRQHRLPSPPRLSFLKRSMNGVSFQEDVLLTIKQRFPDDFAKIVETFPFVEAKLARHELRRKSWKQKTYVDRWGTSLRDR